MGTSGKRLSCILFLMAALVPAITGQNCSPGSVSLVGDVRCSCYRDPNSQVCAMYKAGFYDSGKQLEAINRNHFGKAIVNLTGPRGTRPSAGIAAPRPAVRPTAPRVATIGGHTDYVRFAHPDPGSFVGLEIRKILTLARSLGFIPPDQDLRQNAVLGAMLAEVDRLWISVGREGPHDFLLLVTGDLGKGGVANYFYGLGVMPVFLGDARAMLVGPEPAVQQALRRLRGPAASVNRHVRGLASNYHAYVFADPRGRPELADNPFAQLKKVTVALRVEGEPKAVGEIQAEGAEAIDALLAWFESMKTKGEPGLDSLRLERVSPVALAASVEGFVPTNQKGLGSTLAVKLFPVLMGAFPGQPSSAVSEQQVQAIKKGMTREQVLEAAGRPLSVSAIQGLEVPRESWSYHVAFGRDVTVRIEGGVVTVPPVP